MLYIGMQCSMGLGGGGGGKSPVSDDVISLGKNREIQQYS